MKAWTIIAVLVATAAPIAAGAQRIAATGDRIRIQQADGSVLVGTVVESSPAQLRLLGDGGELVVATDRIQSLERSLGEGRQFVKYFFITIGAGAVVGGALSAATYEPCHETGFLACFLTPESRTDAFAWGFAGGAILGVPIGVIVGLAVKGERWEPISLPTSQDFAISLEPVVGRGFGIRGSIAVGGPRR